jgi:hypothetical protein
MDLRIPAYDLRAAARLQEKSIALKFRAYFLRYKKTEVAVSLCLAIPSGSQK